MTRGGEEGEASRGYQPRLVGGWLKRQRNVTLQEGSHLRVTSASPTSRGTWWGLSSLRQLSLLPAVPKLMSASDPAPL